MELYERGEENINITVRMNKPLQVNIKIVYKVTISSNARDYYQIIILTTD